MQADNNRPFKTTNPEDFGDVFEGGGAGAGPRFRIKPLHLLLGLLPYYLPFALYGFHSWLWLNFSGPTMETISMLLMFGSKGLEAPAYYTRTGLVYMVLVPLIVSFILSLFDQWLRLWLKNRATSDRAVKKIDRAGWWIKFLLVTVLAAVSVAIFWSGAAGTAYMRNHFVLKKHPDYFQQNYVDPKNVSLTVPKQKKNLVIIYVESLEDSFKDPAYYGRNLLAGLQGVEDKSLVPHFNTVGTAVHTQAGHIATQCGIPIKSVFFTNINNAQGEVSLLQNAVCLSDILKKHGYHNVFMQAAYRNSAGLGDFYTADHGFDEAYHMEDFQRNGYGKEISEKQGQWGLHDKYIFEEGYQKLATLQNKRKTDGSPFFLIITTIDMHLPANSSCTANLSHKVDNLDKVVECTAQYANEFFNKAEKNGLLKDTEVLFMGDHRMAAMAHVDINKWNKDYPRREVYGFFYNHKSTRAARQEITHYDIFPSLLDLMGFKVGGGRLGFGYSLFQDIPNVPTIAQQRQIVVKSLYVSPFYLRLWALPDDARKQYMQPMLAPALAPEVKKIKKLAPAKPSAPEPSTPEPSTPDAN